MPIYQQLATQLHLPDEEVKQIVSIPIGPANQSKANQVKNHRKRAPMFKASALDNRTQVLVDHWATQAITWLKILNDVYSLIKT